MAAITPLITRTDFSPYVDVAANLQDVKLAPRIMEAQTFDFEPLIGELMYQDLFDTPATYTELIFKPVIVYFAAARLITSLDLHITPNGVMTKRNEYSDHLDRGAISFKSTEYSNLAYAYWSKIKEQITKAGKNAYPLYIGFENCHDDNNNGFKPRLFGVKGNNSYSPGYGYGSR